MKVVLVDDSEAVQRSFGDLLESVPGLVLVGIADGAATACSLIDAFEPHLVVLDLELRHGGQGMDVLRYVRQWHVKTQVIVLSNFTGPRIRADMLAAGALQFFDKSSQFLMARDWIAARAAHAEFGADSPG